MKIALCLSGQSRTVDTRGIKIEFLESIVGFQENILAPNDIDVFIHTWSTDDSVRHKKELENNFHPKKIIIEKSIFPNYKLPVFKKPSHWYQDYNFDLKLQAMSSRWDSQKKVNLLRKEYQKESGTKYDFIISCRFDLIYYQPFPWDLMNPELYYFSNWHAPWNPKHLVPGYNDPWFISGPELTDIYSTIFDDLHKNWADDSKYEIYLTKDRKMSKEDKFSAHIIIRWHFLNKGLIEKERFIGVEHETWNLVRKSRILINPWWKCPWDTKRPFNPNSSNRYNSYLGMLEND